MDPLIFLRVAVGEAESGRLAVESTQRIYPPIVYPWSEAPAAVIVVVVEAGVLEFAFDKDILKTGVRDLFQPLGKVFVTGLRPGMKSFPGGRQDIRDDVAAITTSSSISVKARFLKMSNLLLMSGEGFCKIEVRHILFKKICFFDFLK